MDDIIPHMYQNPPPAFGHSAKWSGLKVNMHLSQIIATWSYLTLLHFPMKLLAGCWGSSADLEEVQGLTADLVEEGPLADLERHESLEMGCTQEQLQVWF